MMKFRKFLCSVLALTVLTVPLISGCKHIENTDLFQVESQVSTAVSTPSQTSQNSLSSPNPSTDNTPSDSASQITPSLWKASDEQGNYIYLFGSIHAGDSAVDNMPDYFEKAYAECTTLAFEVDMTSMYGDITSSSMLLNDVIYTDGTTIKDHISNDTYNKLVQIMKDNNVYNSMYDQFKPLMWESVIENLIITKAGLSSAKGVDITLTNRAQTDGKNITEVESAEFQMNLFNNLSDEVIDLMLKQYTIDNAIDMQSTAIKELYERWKTGTITADDVSNDINDTMLTDEEKALIAEYDSELLTNRNDDMTEKVIDMMNSDEIVMLVVGTAHYLGDDGIIALLEEQGITVTAITSPEQITQSSALPKAA